MSDGLYRNAHSPEIERAVLSVVLDGRHRESAATLAEVCPTPDHFWSRNHQLVVRAITHLANAGERVDAVTVQTALMRIRFHDILDVTKGAKRVHLEDGLSMSDSLFAAIGADRWHEITGAGGSPSGLRRNCELVAEYHAKRQMIGLLSRGLDAAVEPTTAEAIQKIGDDVVNGVSRIVGGCAVAVTMDEAMASALRFHDAAALVQDARSATWGLPGLDKLLPLRGGRLICLAAAPGHGKTSLALQAAVKSSEALGVGSVSLVTLEMPPEELAGILIAREIGTTTRNLERGWLTGDQRGKAEALRSRWEGTNFGIKDAGGGGSIEHVVAWIRQRHVRSGGRLSLVVVDYLQLIEPSTARQDERARITSATRALKSIARDLRICVLMLSQMSREGRKGVRGPGGEAKGVPEPRATDLLGSSSIESDSDGIVFIWTTATDLRAHHLPVFLKVDKNRGGSVGQIEAMFDKANGQTFADLSWASERKHHAHEPRPDEDKYAEMGREQPEPET